MRQRKLLSENCSECNGLCQEDTCNCPHHYPDPDEEVAESIEQPPFSSKLDDDVE